jgi:hypothetical protein
MRAGAKRFRGWRNRIRLQGEIRQKMGCAAPHFYTNLTLEPIASMLRAYGIDEVSREATKGKLRHELM